ncbi:MAG: MAPEG family protein [Sphingomonadaceae bacterium]|nr:MAPEG family protein [Sphingomonadaceae bacterium]
MASPDFPARNPVLIAGVVASATVAALIWAARFTLIPPIAGLEGQDAGLIFAIKCACVAALLCLLAGVEAVAHERLFGPSFNPLAGHESPRMRVNLRYLSNTLEQFVLFAVGLLGLALYADPRSVAAATLVWVLGRWAFWIGYHISPSHRGIGMAGVGQSLIVLVYVAWRFGGEIAGPAGAVALTGIFAAIEAVLFTAARRPQ